MKPDSHKVVLVVKVVQKDPKDKGLQLLVFVFSVFLHNDPNDEVWIRRKISPGINVATSSYRYFVKHQNHRLLLATVYILGEPEKVPTFENSENQEFFTYLNDIISS